MAYATGKHAFGLCDYCGQRFLLNDLRKNWKGFMVCNKDYEPKEPQLLPLRETADPIALQDPRPDRKEPLLVIVGAKNDSLFLSSGMQPAPVAKPIVGSVKVGTVTVVIS